MLACRTTAVVRLELLLEQIKAVEAERDALLDAEQMSRYI